jgi:uncharacterized protein (TIGR02246 family)
MRRESMGPMLAAVLLSVTPALAMAQQKSDQKGAEQQIRQLDQQWVEAVKSKDVGAIAEFYTEDGVIMPPNAELAQGREAIRKVWEGMVQLPNFSLNFEPSTIKTAEAGDMAFEIGTYKLAFKPAQGGIEDIGKYVVVWSKEDGDWKAVADIFNSNLPIQQQ